jgi:hypothetical protein
LISFIGGTPLLLGVVPQNIVLRQP